MQGPLLLDRKLGCRSARWVFDLSVPKIIERASELK
jgi:hypothetical protein